MGLKNLLRLLYCGLDHAAAAGPAVDFTSKRLPQTEFNTGNLWQYLGTILGLLRAKLGHPKRVSVKQRSDPCRGHH